MKRSLKGPTHVAVVSPDMATADRNRVKLLCDEFGFEIQEHLPFSVWSGQPSKLTILFCDLRLKSIARLLASSLFGNVHTVTVWALETYDYCGQAAFEESLRSFRRSSHLSAAKSLAITFRIVLRLVYRLVTVVMLKTLAAITDLTFILPSEGRRAHFARRFSKEARTIVLRNSSCLPTESLTTKFKIPVELHDRYLFLGGAVNSCADLLLVLEFCREMDLQFVIAGERNPHLEELQIRYTDTLVLVGFLDHPAVLRVLSQALAAVVIYDDLSINQRLSASSKITEAMSLGKWIVGTANQGILEIVEEFGYTKFMLISDLVGNSCAFIDQANGVQVEGSKFDERFSFEREIEKNHHELTSWFTG